MRKRDPQKKVPKATAKRFPLYLRYLNMLRDSGVNRINSQEFSRIVHVSPATIRRDFSHLGELGRSGYGYDVPHVIDAFTSTLKICEEKRVALIGCGDLGQALLKNNEYKQDNLTIVCAFDQSEEVIGQTVKGIRIQPIEELSEMVKRQAATVAISAVSDQSSQAVVDAIVATGITSILNFSLTKVSMPPEVNVLAVDLTAELQTLIYFNEFVTMMNS